MGIRIMRGEGEEARRELWAYTNAFPGMPWGEADGVYEFAPFDQSDIPMFDDMQLNQVIGVFEL